MSSPLPFGSAVMLARARAYAVCGLCTATAASFFLTGVTPLPVLLYFPLSRRFAFQQARGGSPPELAMDFYGRALLALLAGLAVGLSTYAVLLLVSSRSAPSRSRAAEKADAESLPPAAASEKEAAPAPKLTRAALGGGVTLTLFTAYAATALLLAIGLYAYQLSVRVPTPEQLPVAPAPQAVAP